jgi:hypothetical protein
MFMKTLLPMMGLSLLLGAHVASAEPAGSSDGPATPAETVVESSKPAAVLTGDVIDHGPFEVLLKKYVDRRGQVDYGAWASSREDMASLEQYVEAIGRARVEGKSEASRLAFYINAYNALVLRAVLKRWPVETVMKVDGFFTAEKHRVANEEMTLDDLEHNKVIRVQFSEPRIHFVLVCAAKSCPRLLQSALTEGNLEAQLEAATREFIPGATRRRGNQLVTSQLFNWFARDFVANAGSVAAYLARYLDAETGQLLLDGKLTIDFSEYDWSINAR